MDEQKVSDLKSTAVLADDYALAHKKSGFSHKPYLVKYHWWGHKKVNPRGKRGIGRGHLRRLPVTSLTVVNWSQSWSFNARLLIFEKRKRVSEIPVGLGNSKQTKVTIEDIVLLPELRYYPNPCRGLWAAFSRILSQRAA